MAGMVACWHCHRDACSCDRGPRRSARLRLLHDSADHTSRLSDDLLLLILTHLGCARTAARTSLVARRWRGLWACLPELIFSKIKQKSLIAGLAKVSAVLPDPAFRNIPDPNPALSLLHVTSNRRFSLAHMTSLFNAAARLGPEILIISITSKDDVRLMLPCLHRTKSIVLDVRGDCLMLAPAGDLPELEMLSLHLYRDFDLDGLLCRCSTLRKLSVCNFWLDTIMINLPSLEELSLDVHEQLRGVNIIAARLKKLRFRANRSILCDEFSLSYSAPNVEQLLWHCDARWSDVQFGLRWSLYDMTIKSSELHGLQQHCPCSHTMSLRIGEFCHFHAVADRGIKHYLSLFPIANISTLELSITFSGIEGHVYGALVLHLLEFYSSIQRLKVDLGPVELGCGGNSFLQLNNSGSQSSISLTDLKEIEVRGFKGENHEIDLLKVIFRGAKMLSRVTVGWSVPLPNRFQCSDRVHCLLKAQPYVKCNIHYGDEVLLPT